jgi:hypothetical protein
MVKRKFSSKRLYKFFKAIVIIVSVIFGLASLGYYLSYLGFDKKLLIEWQEYSKIFPSVKPPMELFDFRETYPEYNDIDDYTLVEKLASKYPQYIELKKKVENYQNLIRKKDGQEKLTLKTYTFGKGGKLDHEFPSSWLRTQGLINGISFKWTNEKPPTQDDIEKMHQQLERYETNIYDFKKRKEESRQTATIYLFFALCVPITFFGGIWGGIALYKYLFPIKEKD